MITAGTSGTLYYPAESNLCKYVLNGYHQPLPCVALADQLNGTIQIRTFVFGAHKILIVPAQWFHKV